MTRGIPLAALAFAAAGCAAPEGLREFTERGIPLREESPSVRLGGSFAADYVQWDRRSRKRPGFDGWARPRLEAEADPGLRLLVEGDLLRDDTPDGLRAAFGEWRAGEGLALRAGRFPVALGTELATPEEESPLAGRSFTSWLDGRTDLGLAAAGETPGGVLRYEAAAVNGNGFGLDGRRRSSDQQSLRVVVRPFAGVFLGAAAARVGDYEDPVVLETPLGIPVFATPPLDGDGGRWLHLEGGFAAGPVAAGLEVVRGEVRDVRLPRGERGTLDELTAWSATLAVSLTGERRRHEGGRWTVDPPRSPLGALELAVRYANADIDRDLFRAGWTTYDPSTQEVRTFSVLLGWRPVARARVAVGWEKTIADDALTVLGGAGPSSIPRVPGSNRDSSFVLRMEIAF